LLPFTLFATRKSPIDEEIFSLVRTRRVLAESWVLGNQYQEYSSFCLAMLEVCQAKNSRTTNQSQILGPCSQMSRQGSNELNPLTQQ
jgi:hypothetical protein